MRRSAFALASLALASLAVPAHALDIRAYPGARLYVEPLDAAHNVNSVLVQNIALVNDAGAPVTVDGVEIALLRGADVTDARTLSSGDLDRTAQRTAPLEAAGMIAALPFHFGGAALLPAGVHLSGVRALAPGEALLIPQQFLAFSGARDAVRIRARLGDATVERVIPLVLTGAKTPLAFPLEGPWYDAASSSPHAHHRWVSSEEFAHDFVRIGAAGKSFSGSGARFTDYFSYGATVHAAAAGRVVRAVNTVAEDAGVLQQPGETSAAYTQRLMADQQARLIAGSDAVTGNVVVIDMGQGEFAIYAHLKPGSLRVQVGDTVAQGQPIAAVGSSGNSTEPHLHFQLCDGPDALACAAIPARFQNIEVWGAIPQRQPQSGDVVWSTQR